MEFLRRYNIQIFISLLVFHTLVLFYITSGLSISYKEADIFFDQVGLLHNLVLISTNIFGQNDYSLRLPFIVFYVLSVLLLYKLVQNYLKYDVDKLFAVAIFMILPGVNSAALVINESIIVIFCTLLYIYLYTKKSVFHYLLLFIYLFIDNSFAILFLALFFYSLKLRDNSLLLISLFLFGMSMTLYGFDIGGRPRGYFLDTFGIYASIFSPLLFLYFFFSLYRVGIKYEKDLIWYISITALVFSFLFSLRQKIYIEDFAPFVVIAVPIMIKLLMHSLRIRLTVFRKKYYVGISMVIFFLVLNFMLMIFNKFIYIFLENPRKHFAYDYQIVKELSSELKSLNINSVVSDNKELENRLKFYGIENSGKYYISDKEPESFDKEVFVTYHNIKVGTFYIVNL